MLFGCGWSLTSLAVESSRNTMAGTGRTLTASPFEQTTQRTLWPRLLILYQLLQCPPWMPSCEPQWTTHISPSSTGLRYSRISECGRCPCLDFYFRFLLFYFALFTIIIINVLINVNVIITSDIIIIIIIDINFCMPVGIAKFLRYGGMLQMSSRSIIN